MGAPSTALPLREQPSVPWTFLGVRVTTVEDAADGALLFRLVTVHRPDIPDLLRLCRQERMLPRYTQTIHYGGAHDPQLILQFVTDDPADQQLTMTFSWHDHAPIFMLLASMPAGLLTVEVQGTLTPLLTFTLDQQALIQMIGEWEHPPGGEPARTP